MTAAVLSLAPNTRFALFRARSTTRADFAEDVRSGLSAPRKTLPPRWFYDALGSSLFDAICFLPEYYVMRAEAEVLATHRKEIAAAFGPDVRLVELGSGLARKTRVFLDDLTIDQPDLEYVPVDVDDETLERVGKDLLSEYDHLRVLGVCSDFTRPSVPLGALSPARGRTVVLFLGSTIGNLDPEAAVGMLTDLRNALAPGDALFLGADLRKSKSILEPAYDDPLGVTAAFNLNLLVRMNRELGGHFDLSAFRHSAFYDEEQGRIEMHLVSLREQRVKVAGHTFAFARGETIHTENSYKYSVEDFQSLARQAGFEAARCWVDPQRLFSIHYLAARAA